MTDNRKGKEFSRKTKAKAYARTKFHRNGKDVHLCDGCQCELVPGQITFDHIKTIEEGGTNDLSNCQVLCKSCDAIKTFGQDIPRIRKGDRQRDKHSGAADKTSPLAGPNRQRKDEIREDLSAARRTKGKLDMPPRRNLFVPAGDPR